MIPSWAATAAAVLAVGTLVQSPSPKMLENLMKKLDEIMRKEMLQHQLVVLQRLLVDVEEAGGIGEAGVGGERLRGAHGGSDVQQVVGHRHLDGGFNNRLVKELFHRFLCVKVLENGLLGLWLDLNQVVPQIHIDAPNMRSQNVLEVDRKFSPPLHHLPKSIRILLHSKQN